MAIYEEDEHFHTFAQNLERIIDQYELTDDQLQRQMEQVTLLVELEDEFRRTLIKSSAGAKVYRSFIHYICNERRNILAARPYFRERQRTFTAEISVALKARSEVALYKFRFNYQFVLFTLKSRDWKPRSKIVALAEKISKVRTEIIEMNMPLAISRARIFYSRTPKSQLTMMDLVQISCEGLMSAVDKFVPPFTRVFRAVAIGRMTGNFIENYSETLIHFYPTDKRKLYRANKLVGRFPDGIDHETLASEVNQGVEIGNHRTNANEIADLMAAASCVSSDLPASAEKSGETVTKISRFAAPDDVRPDVMVEEADVRANVMEAISDSLDPLEKKLLKLKAVNI